MGKADMVLKGIEAIAEKESLPIIGRERGQVLINVIRQTRPRRILEIGTLVGYSTIMMAKELDAKAFLTTIKTHSGRAKLARENIEKADVRPKIDVIVGDAVKVIPKLTGKFDMVFIDAAKEEYFDYLKMVEKKLHKGSVIVADNVGVSTDQMKEYLNYVRSTRNYKSEYIPFGKDGVEVSVKL